MKKKAKGILLVMVLVLSVVFSTCLIFAYEAEDNVTIDGVTIRFKNYISNNMTSSYAETHGSNPSPQTYVNATFYHFDTTANVSGTIYLFQGADGSSRVEVDQNSVSPGNTKIYYRVISNHTTTYHGVTATKPNLTTNAP